MIRRMRAFAPFLLACAIPACGGDDDGTGPDDPLEFFLGTYTLAPAPTMTCDVEPFGEVVLTINELEVYDVSNDSIDVRVPVTMTSDFIEDDTFEFEFEMAADADGGFSGTLPLDVEVPAGGFTAHGDGVFNATGEFIDDDTFEALVSAGFSIAIGDGAETDCSAVASTITGTRQ